MNALQMDPAPGPKAGSEDHGTVWVPNVGVVADPSAEGFDQDANDDQPVFDETDMITMVAKQHVPAGFWERAAYQTLHEAELAALPSGFGLSYHSVSCQWHARWEAEAKNFAPSWGKARSELKALVLAVIQLWKWHVSIQPNDHDAKSHLEKLQEYEKGIGF